MKTKSNIGVSSLVPILFVLTLFLLLSVVAVSVIIAGSGVYEKISGNMDVNYDKRVTLSYLTTKIRQNDCGNISIEEKNNIKMLAIREYYGEYEYVTYVYYDKGDDEISYNNGEGGCIREIFLEVENGKTIDFELGDGQEIIKSKGFDINIEGNSVNIKLVNEKGRQVISKLILRSAG